jgi:hypothetical protein
LGDRTGEIKNIEFAGDPTFWSKFGNKFMCKNVTKLHPLSNFVAIPYIIYSYTTNCMDNWFPESRRGSDNIIHKQGQGESTIENYEG